VSKTNSNLHLPRRAQECKRIVSCPCHVSAIAITNAEAVKRRRHIEDEDLSPPDAKRTGHNHAADSKPRINHSKVKFVEAWLSTSCEATDDENPLPALDLVAADDMPLPSPDDSGASAAFTLSSNQSDKSSASVKDADYRESLGYRNIYINRKKPPTGLMRRAKEIVSGSRSSPEVDEAAAEEVKEISRELETKNEEDIIQQLAPSVIPGMNGVPDRILASSADQQWTNFVPVPLKPSVTTSPPPLPLPRPKPDKAFGYSDKAFTENQLDTVRFLTDPLGRSYATPDRGLLFPFLDDEFKSQGKGGSHVIATNQAAGAGAVAMIGLVELRRRGLGLNTIDYDEPQFFSLSVDHSTVHVYVHWLSVGAEDGQFSFHMEELSLYYLRDLDGLRTVHRTVKNILDWGRKERLQAIRKLLDAYREKFQTERAAAERAAAVASGSTPIETERPKQKQKGRKRKSSNITVTAPNILDKPIAKRAPPLILQSARALSDFIPEPEDEQSALGFIEGDTIEFVNAKAVDENGWLRGRVRGGNGRWGLVPAEYLELESVGEIDWTEEARVEPRNGQKQSNPIPEPEDEQSALGFNEGGTIEFLDPKAVDGNGWLRGRMKRGWEWAVRTRAS
jgi:hypothetical protein